MELDRHVIYGCLAAAVTAATLTTAEAVDGLPSVCAFRRLTGLPCPGCGLTRSWVLTAHGRLGHASERHPFGPPTFLASRCSWCCAVRAPYRWAACRDANSRR